MTPAAYAQALRRFFAAQGNPAEAVAMAAYMKNNFVFFGIKATPRRVLGNTFIKQHGLPERPEDTVRAIWQLPERELHYFAMELCGKLAKKAPPERLTLYEELILNNSWWDSVDYISPHLCGPHFIRYPDLRNHTIKKWRNSSNIWLMRSALLFQMTYKQQTDEELLFSLCREMAGVDEFFIKKAIGWSLRQYARIKPGNVQKFVKNTPLPALSLREALKHF
ncbi:MAG: DNA alkylation repair protein [Bacteroidetes bacterium]|nr:DNA alkylation repair protein [Bacteroidota bacterium]